VLHANVVSKSVGLECGTDVTELPQGAERTPDIIRPNQQVEIAGNAGCRITIKLHCQRRTFQRYEVDVVTESMRYAGNLARVRKLSLCDRTHGRNPAGLVIGTNQGAHSVSRGQRPCIVRH
jgi:hypothetical protein